LARADNVADIRGPRIGSLNLDPYRYPYLTQKEKSRAKTQRRQEIFKDLPKRQVTGYRGWTAQPPQQRTEATEISWGGNYYLLRYCFYYYLCDLASWRE
jgi:muramoyltetrapeptide carboxypeptidase LdcA involved in peptidoglycan recycling